MALGKCDKYQYYIFGMLFSVITRSLHMDKLFPANWLSVHWADNWNSFIFKYMEVIMPASRHPLGDV